MSRDELAKLGLAVANNEVYRVSSGQNGRIVLDPVPWEVQKSPAVEGDPTVGIAIESFSAEIAGIVKKIALNPMIYMNHGFAVGSGIFKGDIADFINFCVGLTCDKGFGFNPMIQTRAC
jgi:hypothetical protein